MGKEEEVYKCEKGISLDECELAILRIAVDKAEEKEGHAIVNSPEVKKIISIIEQYLKDTKLVAYGGTAINSILPLEDQFYSKDVEIPDYDFFSPNAKEDAKKLADIYVKKGFTEVEAKNGVHEGTYKVFVNFIPVADITYIHKDIFSAIKREAIKKDGILYAPPNYLRMAMYLELSRPAGDVSRWEKVLKRITLLNKNYPLQADNCWKKDFQRKMDTTDNNVDEIYDTIRETFIKDQVVFFGGYAISLYSAYMPSKLKHKFKKYPDFDVLSVTPKKTAEKVKKALEKIGIDNVSLIERSSIGEIIAEHYEIKINNETVAFVYQPSACHSYNIINIDGEKVKIATIDTMLSFYLAFLYANKKYYDINRILCMSQYLFKVQQHNRLQQKGLLRRFSVECYGHQETLEEMRAHKARKFIELKGKKGTEEYEKHFMRYRPADLKADINTNTPISKSSSTKSSSVKSLSKSSSSSTKSSLSKSSSPMSLSVKSSSPKSSTRPLSIRSSSMKSSSIKSSPTWSSTPTSLSSRPSSQRSSSQKSSTRTKIIRKKRPKTKKKGWWD